tara:strand:+ start:1698 stop:1880 length:183 start_codon:yes stop_codon:yes gene_type:complete
MTELILLGDAVAFPGVAIRVKVLSNKWHRLNTTFYRRALSQQDEKGRSLMAAFSIDGACV